MPLDLNRDGKQDLIFRPTHPVRLVYMMVNTGDGFETVQDISAKWGLTEKFWAMDQYNIIPHDLEGDGIMDLIFSSLTPGTSSYYLKGSAQGFFEEVKVIDGLFGLSQAEWNSASRRVITGDFNGDGLSDLLSVADDA